MSDLYQFVFGYQPHYVVAESYADAEKTIKETGYSPAKQIECLGPYVYISKKTLNLEVNPDDD